MLTYAERARLEKQAKALRDWRAGQLAAGGVRWVTCPQCGARCEVWYLRRAEKWGVFHPYAGTVQCRLHRAAFYRPTMEETAAAHAEFSAGYNAAAWAGSAEAPEWTTFAEIEAAVLSRRQQVRSMMAKLLREQKAKARAAKERMVT